MLLHVLPDDFLGSLEALTLSQDATLSPRGLCPLGAAGLVLGYVLVVFSCCILVLWLC